MNDKIVSKTKTHSPHPEKIPIILSTRTEQSLPDNLEGQQVFGMMDMIK